MTFEPRPEYKYTYVDGDEPPHDFKEEWDTADPRRIKKRLPWNELYEFPPEPPKYLPPKPTVPAILRQKNKVFKFFDGNTPETNFLATVGNTTMAGSFAALVKCWWMDVHMKASYTFQQEALELWRQSRTPFLGGISVGLAYGGTQYLLERTRGGDYHRSLQEHFLLAFVGAFPFGVLWGKSIYSGVKTGFWMGLFNVTLRFYYFKVAKMSALKEQRKLDRMYRAVYEDPPKIPEFHKRRHIYSIYSEEQGDHIVYPKRVDVIHE